MTFETKINELIRAINPRAKHRFFNHTLFITTDNQTTTYDAYEIVDAITQLPYLGKSKVGSGRVGDEIYIDFK